MSGFKRYGAFFLLGGVLYACLELLWRGRTHWSMALTGGLCMAVLRYISLHCRSISVWSRALIGCAFITLAEFLVGLAVNLALGWKVWDYSGMPLNFMGQICLSYCALWYILCFPGMYICTLVEKKIFSVKRDNIE